MKYKNTNMVTETQLNLDWYNRLLDIDDLSQHDDEHLALIEDECYGLYEFEFEDGSTITVDLCHGDINYYDDCVWTNKEKTKTITFGCQYCLDAEMEFTVGCNTYICHLTLDDDEKSLLNEVEDRPNEKKQEEKREEIKPISQMTSEELFVAMNNVQLRDIYDMVRFGLVLQDIESRMEELCETDELSEETKTVCENVAHAYVYNGDYDSNLSYWDNIDNLIKKFSD